MRLEVVESGHLPEQAAALELNGEARLTTFELIPEWAGHAGELFAELALTERMDQRIGALEETLEPELGRLGTVDYAYVDADHAEEPNRRYLETMLPHLSPGAVLVYDDVSLDSEMRQTWAMVRSHDRIGVTAAAHRMGVAIVAG